MRSKLLWIVALAALFGAMLHAQDISGDWQGTLKTGTPELRIVVQFTKDADGGWKASWFGIDHGTEGISADSVTLQGSNLKLTVRAAIYEGKISADWASINGTWTERAGPLPLELKRATKETAWQIDPTPHTVQLLTVDNNVRLEVIDWGGSGRPVVLLAGLGNNAHVFDKFAPKLTGAYHVYGITRRGFGASGAPAPTTVNYSTDRLGDDVLAVIDSLKLNRSVLVGHSLGGEELSSVGSRHAEKVAGLIYLDAGYSYTYCNHPQGDLMIDPVGPQPAFPTIKQAIQAGMQKYTDIRVPILAIYAGSGLLRDDPALRAAAEAKEKLKNFYGAQAKAFDTCFSSARIVRLPDATHYLFQSNEADVLREMNAFIGSLP